MTRRNISEKLLLQEIDQAAKILNHTLKGLSIGKVIQAIRLQLGMSQAVLAKRASMPQATLSRIEKGQKNSTLSTLQKVFKALSCDLVIAPVFREPIDQMRRKQARKVAEKHVRYLRGTMNLEKQEPDSRLIEELLKKEEEELLHKPESKLWEE